VCVTAPTLWWAGDLVAGQAQAPIMHPYSSACAAANRTQIHAVIPMTCILGRASLGRGLASRGSRATGAADCRRAADGAWVGLGNHWVIFAKRTDNWGRGELDADRPAHAEGRPGAIRTQIRRVFSMTYIFRRHANMRGPSRWMFLVEFIAVLA